MDESTIEPKFCVFCNDWHTPMECRGKIAVEAMQQRRRDMFEKLALNYEPVTYEKLLSNEWRDNIYREISTWTTFILESADKFAEGKE